MSWSLSWPIATAAAAELHYTCRLFWQNLSRKFSSAVCWWWSHTAHAPRMHARQTVFCQPSSIYLSLK